MTLLALSARNKKLFPFRKVSQIIAMKKSRLDDSFSGETSSRFDSGYKIGSKRFPTENTSIESFTLNTLNKKYLKIYSFLFSSRSFTPEAEPTHVLCTNGRHLTAAC